MMRVATDVTSGRWWLALAYVLTTLLARGGHHHAPGGPEPIESHGDCDESRRHVADHPVADPGSGPVDCPACHFRAEHSLGEFAPAPLPGRVVAVVDDPTRPSPRAGAPLRNRCRAPPTA